MDIAPIRTKRDYRRALKEIEALMDAKCGTPDGDRLDVLVTLVHGAGTGYLSANDIVRAEGMVKDEVTNADVVGEAVSAGEARRPVLRRFVADSL